MDQKQDTSVRVLLYHADWVIAGLMKPSWVEATRRIAGPPSITDAPLANCFHRAPYRRAVQHVSASQAQTVPRLPPPPQKSSFIPTASGTFQFVTVWCLWARTYCWDSLFPRRRKHRLWNHITWARRLWKWLQMLRLDYHVWVSATYSHFSGTAREFCCKRRAAALPRYRSAQICSFAKDIKMKASDRDAASRREGAWRDMKSQPQGFDCFFFFFSISQEASLWSSECLPSKLTPGLRTAVVTHLCHHQSTRHSPPNNPSTGHMFDEPSFEESGLKNICPRRLINVPTRPGHRSQAKPSARQRRRSQSVPRSSSKSSTIIKISQVLSSHLYLRPVGTKEVWQRQWIPAVTLKFGMKKLSGILVP